MSKRQPVVGGNWKMNLHQQQAVELAQAIDGGFSATTKVQTLIFPPFVYLAQVAQALAERSSTIVVGAQDCYHQANGAFTGEISLSMLSDIGCRSVLVGHCERRHVLGECNTLLNEKTLAALDAGMEVVFCVGELQAQREAGKTDAINAGQLSLGLAGVRAQQMAQIVIAYEPVWAIGTGLTATPADAQSAHAAIRCHLAGMFNDEVAMNTRIIYGGSCKASNAGELFAQVDVDGGLIGGASLKAADFIGILEAAALQD